MLSPGNDSLFALKKYQLYIPVLNLEFQPSEKVKYNLILSTVTAVVGVVWQGGSCSVLWKLIIKNKEARISNVGGYHNKCEIIVNNVADYV